MARICEIKEKEYLDKKFEAAKEILPVLLNSVSQEYISDKKKRESLVYNSTIIADTLLRELGYRFKGQPKQIEEEYDITAINEINDLIIRKERR